MSDPNEVYKAVLSQLKSARSKRSLEALHEVCHDHYDSGAADFRVTTIAKIGASRGVPKAQTIRNKAGEPYRALIDAWNALGDQRKKEIQGRIEPAGKHDWVKDVESPAHRFLILDLIGKVRRLKAERQTLASITKLEIDLRSTEQTADQAQLPTFSSLELEALKEAISDDFLTRQGWVRGERGNINGQNGKVIFRNGFVDAIEKLLSLNHG